MRDLHRTTSRVASFGAALLLVGLLPDRDAWAYCTYAKEKYAFHHPGCGTDREVHIYLNAGAKDIARVGLPIEDIERMVRSAIAAYNESGAPLPRLTYGGRVFHNTEYVLAPNQTHPEAVESYKQNWKLAEPDRPLGITIHARSCPPGLPSQLAGTLALNFGGAHNVGFDIIQFTPFFDENGNVCPRAGEYVNCASPPDEEAPVPVGEPCMNLGEETSCNCEVGPAGVHRCSKPGDDLPAVWTGCLCTSRTYQTFDIGDGVPNPLEPDTCDAVGAGTADFLGVLMHELGHAVGMDHSDLTEADCKGLFLLGDTQGIMRSVSYGSQLSRGRRPNADDLEGMTAFFEFLEIPWKRDFDVVFYESLDSGQTWGAAIPVPLPTTGVRTRPAVTSATDSTGFQAMAFGDAAGDVYHVTRDADGFQVFPSEQAKVPAAFSRFPVAVAYGAGRLMIAWFHQESFEEYSANIQWAIRDTNINGAFDWTFGDYRSQVGDSGNFFHRELGAGYEPELGAFVISTIDRNGFPPAFAESAPIFIAVDPLTGAVLGTAKVETPVLRSIGKPVCYDTEPPFVAPSHCALPVVAAVPGGPELQMLQVAFALDMEPDPLTIPAFNRQPLGLVDHGLVDLAGDVRDPGDVRLIGAFTDAVLESPVRFEVLRTRPLPAAGRPPLEPGGVEQLVVSEGPGAPGPAALPAWPAAIGSQWIGNDVIFSAWRVDPSQSDLAPGESTGGDDTTTGACDTTTSGGLPTTTEVPTTSATGAGTSATSTSSSTGDTSPATTGPGDPPPGCDCQASGVTPPWWLLLFPALPRRRDPRRDRRGSCRHAKNAQCRPSQAC